MTKSDFWKNSGLSDKEVQEWKPVMSDLDRYSRSVSRTEALVKKRMMEFTRLGHRKVVLPSLDQEPPFNSSSLVHALVHGHKMDR